MIMSKANLWFVQSLCASPTCGMFRLQHDEQASSNNYCPSQKEEKKVPSQQGDQQRGVFQQNLQVEQMNCKILKK